MSENLDLVRSIYADWERGDFSSVDWADPEIEYFVVDGPVPDSWTGVAAMAGAWREFTKDWGDYRAEADEFREIDSERVLVLLHATARGRASGADVRQTRARGANVFHLHDGKVSRLDVYFDSQRASGDLGLAE
jgi:ketosteroid isomerase-like protein